MQPDVERLSQIGEAARQSVSMDDPDMNERRDASTAVSATVQLW
ncbi:hypothetical protein [Nitratireductor rhodophyticola]|nr:hypothetical protein [Nitratireductor rhodophyticola]